MEKKLKNQLINILRQASYRHKDRAEAKRKARVAAATYECKHCGIWVYDGKKDITTLEFDKETIAGKICIDHISPIVPITGWDDFQGFIERLFCKEDMMQILCKSCHKIKTDEENQERKKYKEKK